MSSSPIETGRSAATAGGSPPTVTVELTLPALGANVLEAIVVAWEKHPGDQVEQGEPICIVSAEGLRAAVASSTSGQLVRLLAGVGARVGPGASLAEIESEQVAPEDPRTDEVEDAIDDPAPVEDAIEDPGPVEDAIDDPAPVEDAIDDRAPMQDAIEDRVPEEKGPEPAAAEEAQFDSPAEPKALARPQPKPIAMSSFHSPAVRRLAAAHGVDLALVPGNGIGGRVRKEDVLAYLAKHPCEPTSDSSTSTR